MTDGQTVEFFFSAGSRYRFLAGTPLPRLSARTRRRFDWRPVRSTEIRLRRVFHALSAFIVLASAPPGIAEAAEVPKRLGSDLEGNPIESSSFRGKVLLVSLWASWCRSCMEELPFLDALQREYGDRQVVILAVNSGEPRHKVRTFLEQYPLSLPVARDPAGRVGRRLKVRGLPAHALIHPSGELCSVFSGGEPEVLTRIKAAIDALLEGKPCTPDS